MKIISLFIIVFITLGFMSNSSVLIDSKENTIYSRYNCLEGFKRNNTDSNSFSFYLSHLPLKSYGSKAKYYDGRFKEPEQIYNGVVDMSISNKNLQQCADAVMRLRAEYLYQQKRFEQIKFRFLSDGQYHDFKSYSKGDYTYKTFLKYMDWVFTYANTASLKQQLTSKQYTEIQIGDVFIQSGNPYGHAVIVVDLCTDTKGNKKYMLAQSYMPAQETQILLNPKTNHNWYDWNLKDSVIQTPEWTFFKTDLRTW